MTLKGFHSSHSKILMFCLLKKQLLVTPKTANLTEPIELRENDITKEIYVLNEDSRPSTMSQPQFASKEEVKFPATDIKKTGHFN